MLAITTKEASLGLHFERGSVSSVTFLRFYQFVLILKKSCQITNVCKTIYQNE